MDDARPMEQKRKYDVQRKREQEEEQNGRERGRPKSRSRLSSVQAVQVDGVEIEKKSTNHPLHSKR